MKALRDRGTTTQKLLMRMKSAAGRLANHQSVNLVKFEIYHCQKSQVVFDSTLISPNSQHLDLSMRAISGFVLLACAVAVCAAGFPKYEFDPNMCANPASPPDARLPPVQSPRHTDPHNAGQKRRSPFGAQPAPGVCFAQLGLHTACPILHSQSCCPSLPLLLSLSLPPLYHILAPIALPSVLKHVIPP